MYVGDNQFIVIGNGISYNSLSADKRVERLHGYGYYYTIIRPSFALEGN